MNRVIATFMFVALVCASACSSTGAPPANAEQDPKVFVEDKHDAPETEAAVPAVEHPALAGCREPDKNDCNPCCDAKAEPGACHKREWAGGGHTEVDPWYNKVSRVEGDCPADCKLCASCSERAEQQFKRLVARPDCDCSEDPGVDPCFRPDSCGCHCVRYEQLSSACPHLEVAPSPEP